MNIKEKIKRIFGRPNYILPICDKNNYGINIKSFTGNSLANSNILIVSNYKYAQIDFNINQILKQNENCNCSYIYDLKGELTIRKINNSANNLLGNYDHIINIIEINDQKSSSLNESVYLTYQWMQQETEYLVNLNRYASISTAVVYTRSNSIFTKTIAESIISLIKGLGKVLPNHSIVCNGLIATSDIDLKNVFISLAYLSSKYGQILTGETLTLK